VLRTRLHGGYYKESDRREGHKSQRSRTLGDDAEAARRFGSGELSNIQLAPCLNLGGWYMVWQYGACRGPVLMTEKDKTWNGDNLCARMLRLVFSIIKC